MHLPVFIHVYKCINLLHYGLSSVLSSQSLCGRCPLSQGDSVARIIIFSLLPVLNCFLIPN